MALPAGFSIEFALVRSSPRRFDCVLSIVVWCGMLSHHQIEPPATSKEANKTHKNQWQAWD
jgi:hypothetical protein